MENFSPLITPFCSLPSPRLANAQTGSGSRHPPRQKHWAWQVPVGANGLEPSVRSSGGQMEGGGRSNQKGRLMKSSSLPPSQPVFLWLGFFVFNYLRSFVVCVGVQQSKEFLGKADWFIFWAFPSCQNGRCHWLRSWVTKCLLAGIDRKLVAGRRE